MMETVLTNKYKVSEEEFNSMLLRLPILQMGFAP